MSKYWDDSELNLDPVNYNSDLNLMFLTFRQKKVCSQSVGALLDQGFSLIVS